jgi:hypothetical protein
LIPKTELSCCTKRRMEYWRSTIRGHVNNVEIG